MISNSKCKRLCHEHKSHLIALFISFLLLTLCHCSANQENNGKIITATPQPQPLYNLPSSGLKKGADRTHDRPTQNVWAHEDNASFDGSQDVWAHEDNASSDLMQDMWAHEDNASFDGSQDMWAHEDNASFDGSQDMWAREDNASFDGSQDMWAREDNASFDGSQDMWAREDNASFDGSQDMWVREDNASSDLMQDMWAREDNASFDGSQNVWAHEDNASFDGSQDMWVREDNASFDGSQDIGAHEDNASFDRSSVPLSRVVRVLEGNEDEVLHMSNTSSSERTTSSRSTSITLSNVSSSNVVLAENSCYKTNFFLCLVLFVIGISVYALLMRLRVVSSLKGEVKAREADSSFYDDLHQSVPSARSSVTGGGFFHFSVCTWRTLKFLAMRGLKGRRAATLVDSAPSEYMTQLDVLPVCRHSHSAPLCTLHCSASQCNATSQSVEQTSSSQASDTCAVTIY